MERPAEAGAWEGPLRQGATIQLRQQSLNEVLGWIQEKTATDKMSMDRQTMMFRTMEELAVHIHGLYAKAQGQVH